MQIRTISEIKEKMKRFNRIAEHYYKKKKYKEYAQAMAYFSLLEWVLGKNNEWEQRKGIKNTSLERVKKWN